MPTRPRSGGISNPWNQSGLHNRKPLRTRGTGLFLVTNCGLQSGMPRIAILCLSFCLAGPSLADGSRCLRTYEMNRSDFRGAGTGWKFLGGLFFTKDGERYAKIQRWPPGGWTSCGCLEGKSSCTCCDIDMEKLCAEVAHSNATTNNKLIIGTCPQ